MSTKSVPLDATLIKGSHGVPQTAGQEQGVLVSSDGSLDVDERLTEAQIFAAVMKFFGH